MAPRVSDEERRRAAAVARERGCLEAARFIVEGRRFPSTVSRMRPAERRAWQALNAVRSR